MNTSPSSPKPSRLSILLLLLWPALIACCLYYGWGRWSDAQIDFGRELYVPWQLSEGQQLYRDIAYFNGPLSPYFNALCFKVFGVGYWTLVGVNAFLLSGFCALIWRALRRALPDSADGLATIAFLLFASGAFFFGQQVLCGNYNFLSPYSHEATHGLMLGVLAIAAAMRAAASRRRHFCIGLLLGLVFLTKVELFAASLAGVAWLLMAKPRRAEFCRGLPSLLTGILLPSISALFLLGLHMPLGQALLGILGGWPQLLAGEASELLFYHNILGMDAPWQNALGLLRATGVLLAVLMLGSLLARRAPNSVWIALFLFVLSYYAWRNVEGGPWDPADWLARCLPLASLIMLASGRLFRSRIAKLDAKGRWSSWCALAVFGLVLLAKMILQPRFAHYGFFLSLPASAALIAFAIGWLPKLIDAPRQHLVALVLGAYGAAAAGLLETSLGFFSIQNSPLASGTDAIRGDFRAPQLAEALGIIETRLDSTDELLVLPEGISLNYMARLQTPTRFINFMPLELLLYGEDVILAELRESPPKAILLVHKDTSEYGFPFFGKDYGQAIMGWVKANYERTWGSSRGGEPLEPGTIFGTALYQIRPALK